MSITAKLLKIFAASLWISSIMACAGSVPEKALDTSSISALDQSYATARFQCYQTFFSNACISRVREDYIAQRLQLVQIQNQERSQDRQTNLDQALQRRAALQKSFTQQDQLVANEIAQKLTPTPSITSTATESTPPTVHDLCVNATNTVAQAIQPSDQHKSKTTHSNPFEMVKDTTAQTGLCPQ